MNDLEKTNEGLEMQPRELGGKLKEVEWWREKEMWGIGEGVGGATPFSQKYLLYKNASLKDEVPKGAEELAKALGYG